MAQAAPDRLQVVGVVTQTDAEAARITARWGVRAVRTVGEVLALGPEFVVAAVSWPAMPGVVRELVAAGAKVLAETPPAPDLDGLRALWNDVGASGLVQVGEQYTLMPGHASRLAVVREGVVGTPTAVEIASTHLYHAVALVRAFLDVDMDETVGHDLGGNDLALLSFPSLDLPMSEQVRRNDYAPAVKPLDTSERIPTTMGLGPMPIAAAASGNAADAARWIARNAADDMFKPPFNVRPETATNNTGYFLTGSGGYVQGLLYGLTGLRIEPDGLLETYPPVLPPTWKSMTLKDITFRGRHYDITLDRDASGKTRLTRKTL